MMEQIELAKTIVIDIDGVIFRHYGNLTLQLTQLPELLPGVIDKFNEWNKKGYVIIILTGRPESMRKITEQQFIAVGLFYDHLVMGATRGERVLINDSKTIESMITASAVQLPRNQGMSELKV